jgi:hypothetical protein
MTVTQATVTASSEYIPKTAIGAPGGVAPLNLLGQIPANYFPSSLRAGAGNTAAAPQVVDGGELA